MFLKDENLPMIQNLEQNKTVAKKVYEIFQSGEFEELDRYIDNNVLEHSPDPFVKGNGIDYVKELFRTYLAAFPDLKITINHIVAENDIVTAHITLIGKNTGSLMGKLPSNKNINIEGFDMCRMKDRKITEHWGIWDSLALMTQLGYIPNNFGV